MDGMSLELLKIFSIARKWPAIDQNKYSNAMGLARKVCSKLAQGLRLD